MSGDPRPPRWTTALVVLGTLSLVALALVVLSTQSSVRSGSLAATPSASATASPSEGPTGSPSTDTGPSPALTPDGGDTDGTPAAVPATPDAPGLSTPTPLASGVDVLNQTLTPGLAGRAAVVVEQRGWPVDLIDNATLGTPATTVYVPVGLEAAGEAFMRALPEVTRTRPAFEGLAVDRLTLVLAEPDALAVVTAMEAAASPAPTPAPTDAPAEASPTR